MEEGSVLVRQLGSGSARLRKPYPEGTALTLPRGGPDLAAHHVHHPPGDREPEAEALCCALRARGRSARRPAPISRGDSRPRVLHLHAAGRRPSRSPAKRNRCPGPACSYRRWRAGRSAPGAAGSGPPGGEVLAPPRRSARGPPAPRPRRRRPPPRRSTSTISTSLGSKRPRPGPASSRDWVSRVIRSASAAQPLEEVLAGLGVVLGTRLQHLDRARDPGERVAQLVGGVGDEVALRPLRAHLIGAVAGHRPAPRPPPAGRGPGPRRRGRRSAAPGGQRSRRSAARRRCGSIGSGRVLSAL